MNTPTGREMKPIVDICEDIIGGCKSIYEMFDKN